MKKIAVILFVVVFTQSLFSQNKVTRNDTIVVIEADTLQLPWASGLNASQTNNIDLDLDGVMDLLMFEPNNEANYETGDKMLPFINTSSSGGYAYKFAPEYRDKFPILENYVILKDWNCDGKMDIFTWDVRQRITAYKNISDTELKFELAKRIIDTDTTDLPNNNPAYFHLGEILWSYFDMPSFEDIDGDGDIDILTTATNGHFIEYNKNMSMEYYNSCDSLTFKLKNTCWGFFFEDTGTVILDTCDIENVPDPEFQGGKWSKSKIGGGKSGSLHSSDALLAIDFTGDGVKDLLAGDGSETGLYSFVNGGKVDSSKIISNKAYFPDIDPFQTTIYGLPFNVDADFDDKLDLVVSVALDRLNDVNGIWFYKNTGTNAQPTFSLQTKSFIQEEMIDVGTQSKPVFFDYNGDSLMDLVIGNYGYFDQLAPIWRNSTYTSQLSLYENIGTKESPIFQLVDSNFANLDTLRLNLNGNKPVKGLHPTFGDLDNDGDEDMILGDRRGKIHVFWNIPNAGKAEFYLAAAEFQSIDVGAYSTPQLFDLDEDGKLDLIVGEETGNLNYFRNTTTGNLSFTLEDDSLGDINVKDGWDWIGFSTPFFYKDSLGNTKLLSGSKSGNIRLYDSIFVNGNISEQFRKVENSYQGLWDGIYSSIHGSDIDNDGQLDFVLGNQSGGISLYTSLDSIYTEGIEDQKEVKEYERIIYPNPAKNEINLKIKCNCNDEFEYSVYNVLGNLLDRKVDRNKVSFNIANFENGMYIIRAENKNRSIIITERFVKSED